MNKQKAIQDLINWSEDAINLSELEANGVPVSTDELMQELRKTVVAAKKSGLSLEEVLEKIWNYSDVAEKIYGETEI